MPKQTSSPDFENDALSKLLNNVETSKQMTVLNTLDVTMVPQKGQTIEYRGRKFYVLLVEHGNIVVEKIGTGKKDSFSIDSYLAWMEHAGKETIMDALETIRVNLGLLISLTPSSPKRNKLCDINIEIMQMQEEERDVQEGFNIVDVSKTGQLPVKKLDGSRKPLVEGLPSFSSNGSVKGMRRVYGPNALLVRCGKFIYNVETKPDIYYEVAK